MIVYLICGIYGRYARICKGMF